MYSENKLRVSVLRVMVYLLLVSFANPHLAKWTAEQLSVFRNSPFDGVASAIESAYFTGSVPDISQFEQAIQLCKRAQVCVWPWVFLNRMIAVDPAGRSHSGGSGKEYFRRIKAMDLDDEVGARSDFIKLWRLALRLARQLDAPGIVADFEAYNNYLAYDPRWLAQRRGESVDEVIRKLRELGAELADVVAEEYPDAIIWQLFFDPYNKPYKTPDGRSFTRSVNYINLGLLDRAKELGIRPVLIDGAEVALGYYQPSLEALRSSIARHKERTKPFLSKYEGLLELGATIAPYADYRLITGWIKKRSGDNPPWKKASDFKPLFRELLSSYRYVWIYAAGAAKFYPYNPTVAEPIFRALSQAREEISGRQGG